MSVQLHVIAACGGDPFAAGAVRVAQSLAGMGSPASLFMLDRAVAPAVVSRCANGLATAIVVLAAPDIGSSERRGYVDRACRIAAATRHPVLCVPETPAWPPRRCVAAMDFSRAAIGAAIIALDFLGSPGHAAYVFVNALVAPEPRPDEAATPRHIRLLFDALPPSARQRPAVVVTQHCLSGLRVPRLVEFAATWGAELLSLGRHGNPSPTGRTEPPMGPTVRGLLALAPCSLVLSGAS